MRNKFEKSAYLISLILVFFIGFFTLGCTKVGEDRDTRLANQDFLGLVIKNVSYSKTIVEGNTLDVRILIENKGDSDARDIKAYLDGLSTRWNPPTSIESLIGNLMKGEKYYIDFSTRSPILGENVTYPFYIRLEYFYLSRYTSVFEINKEDRNVKVSLKSESKSKAPITINVTEYVYDQTSNKLKIKFILINNGIGRVVGDILLNFEDMICDSTRTTIKPESKFSEREIRCELSLPNDFSNYYPQVRMTASYKYTYRSNEYKVNVRIP